MNGVTKSGDELEVLLTSGESFSVQLGETILDAAIRAGVSLDYSCRSGRCRSCRVRLLSGRTSPLMPEIALDPLELEDGWLLTCVRTVSETTLIDAGVRVDLKLTPPRFFPCRIDVLEDVAPGVRKLVLRLPPGERINHLPGQYVELIGPKGVRRSYSVASAASATGRIELLVGRVAGGQISSYVFDHATVGDLLRLRGPLGTFVFRQSTPKHLLLVATGTGIAPIKAILEGVDALAGDVAPLSVHLVWGNRTAEHFHWQPTLKKVPFTFVPVVSRPTASWSGDSGWVQDAIQRRLTTLTDDWNLYACGSLGMIAAVKAVSMRLGLPENACYSDAFVESGS